MTRIAVLGCGYWGSKHVRVFHQHPDVELAMVADPSPKSRAHVQQTYPDVPVTDDYKEIFQRADIHGVVIATPVSTHYQLAREALLAGKDVLVEKPLAPNAAEARELCLLADRLGRVLMVGHTFLYHPGVRYLKQLVDSGALGTIYYADTARLNLGLFQRDTNVFWDLAPHDLSILLHVFGSEPDTIRARGVSHVGARNQIDVGYLDLHFPERISATVRVSWLDPCKVRRVTIVGSHRMAVFNDVANDEKVRVYDRGVEQEYQTDNFADFHLSYRYGDVTIPHLPMTEPLVAECAHFIECINDRRTPLTDGWSGYSVVKLLEDAHRSLALEGASVSCDDDTAGTLPDLLPEVLPERWHGPHIGDEIIGSPLAETGID